MAVPVLGRRACLRRAARSGCSAFRRRGRGRARGALDIGCAFLGWLPGSKTAVVLIVLKQPDSFSEGPRSYLPASDTGGSRFLASLLTLDVVSRCGNHPGGGGVDLHAILSPRGRVARGASVFSCACQSCLDPLWEVSAGICAS